MTAPALSIVIPVFNSARTLPALVAQIAALPIPGGHELVLVNDGSRDDSGDVCWTLAGASPFPIAVVDLSRNFGEHNAVMAGLPHARGRHIIIMDDDFQHPLPEVVRLWSHACACGADVVYTSFSRKRHSPWRTLGSRFCNFLADRLLDKPPGLYLSSFKCLTNFTAHEITAYRGPFPYLDGLIFQITRRVETIEIEHAPRLEGESGYTLRKLIRLWLSMFINFSIMPLRTATVMGLALAVLGLVASVVVFVEALLFATPIGWGSLMASLLVFSGIQLIMLGLMGEYLGRICLTVNGRPQFVVRRMRRGGEAAP
ncbi:glycosyl transferase family 2 [Verrucomicrobia bacterium IMCC26134]|nr:glycosyl transferase family 2 [Verrucomicrobia bacterium IMCC26134]